MIMNFYEVIYNRKTVRKFLGKPVDFEIIKRILEAWNAAPTWNHTRDWSYIILRTEEEKAYAFELYSTAFSAHSLAQFRNPHGLDADGHYTTAKELAMLTAYAYIFPEIRECWKTSSKTIQSLKYGKNGPFDPVIRFWDI